METSFPKFHEILIRIEDYNAYLDGSTIQHILSCLESLGNANVPVPDTDLEKLAEMTTYMEELPARCMLWQDEFIAPANKLEMLTEALGFDYCWVADICLMLFHRGIQRVELSGERAI